MCVLNERIFASLLFVFSKVPECTFLLEKKKRKDNVIYPLFEESAKFIEYYVQENHCLATYILKNSLAL